MDKLYAGFARVDITPMLGIGLAGYYKPRVAEGILDELEINALALSYGEEKAVLLSVDHLGIVQELSERYRIHISNVTGIPTDCIYIHATHTHTAPFLNPDSEDILEQEYAQMVCRKMADASRIALADMKPTKMGWGIGTAPDVAFVRRFRMKDGSVRTNPGVNNVDIAEAIGEVDERVSVLRFDRENAEHIVLVNFGNHPDTVGGNYISADWPGQVRKTVEKSLDDVKCIFFNGVQGDINHINVWPKEGYYNDTFVDFDSVPRGYKHAIYVGRVVTAAVLQAYDKVKYIDVHSLKCKQRTICVPSNMPCAHELEEARYINALHEAGEDDKLPYKGMMLTTVVAKAARMIRLEHGPENFYMTLSAVAIGDVILIGIPGEPFHAVGKMLKDCADWELVLPTCTTNGKQGYFPTEEAYNEGGYEAGSSNFRAGVAELIIEECKQLMDELCQVSE